ncbi:uncharacterized protein [Aristolochia californica]|uniref:uncharacterized protein n=1 Tax=Aristolochia californica TaxID=171875 RepID=UPI0035D9EBB7
MTSPPPVMNDPCRTNQGTTSIHITALDGIVNVNSIFTLAVFVGLAWNPADPNNNLVDNPACLAHRSHAENLVAFHVFSFGSFLFSSLLALALKQGLRLSQRDPHPSTFDVIPTYVNKTLLRAVLLSCAIGSFSGSLFLVLALVNLAQIKLGTLSCGSSMTFGAVVPLLIFVPAGLLVYIGIVMYAFTR